VTSAPATRSASVAPSASRATSPSGRSSPNFVNDTAHANDDQGHGTHVAGTIAQTTNNQLGTAGVAFCATILPVKVLDARGSGSLADVAEGIRWAADHGADVINLSLGGDGHSKIMDQAVEYAHRRGVTVVCAAGNSGRSVGSPANAPLSIAVSAIDSGDQIAFFSSRGPEIAIAAPGVAILQQTICERGRNRCEQFASWSGTSMAAPARRGRRRAHVLAGRHRPRRAIITWTTDEPAVSAVSGTNGFQRRDDTLTKIHRVSVRGKPGSNVEFTILARHGRGDADKTKVDVKF
jgi:subtilisin family serine protease